VTNLSQHHNQSNRCRWGIAGAAIAWALRTTIDLLGLLVFARKINPESLTKLHPNLLMLVCGLGLLIPSIYDFSLAVRSIEVGFILVTYFWVLLRELKADGMLEKMMRFIKSKLALI
jgi:Na+-driven multidrug efflux pump